MAIVFNCPHCQLEYKLADKLAGKQAKCKNPECRKLITIPTPVTVPPDDAPALDAAAAEAAALAALADEAPKPDEAPPEQKVIPMTCPHCTHQWTVAWAMAGKNVLCPNPECRQRQRVPEPKEDVPTDWRQARSKLPSMAKDAQPKLEGVMDAEATKIITAQTAKDAGLFDDDIEPRPLKQKILIGLTIFALIAGAFFGIRAWRGGREEQKEDQLFADAGKALSEAAPTLPQGEAPICSAVLNAAAAEHTLRQEPTELKKAHDLLLKARVDLRPAAGHGRNAVAAELAFLALEFGGTEEQARDRVRFRWTPEAEMKVARPNEVKHTIHEELRQSLAPLMAADFEFRAAVARRMVRELAKRGQATTAAELLPQTLFSDPESYEGRAVVALELYRADNSSPLARKLANDLRGSLGAKVSGNPYPTSAHALFTVLGVEKAPVVMSPPQPQPRGNLSDQQRQAYVTLRLMEGKSAEAVELAGRGGSGAAITESQLRALALCAEWGDAGPAVDVAVGMVNANKGKPMPAPVSLTRLSLAATAAGKHDQAKILSDAITDDGAKAWAKGDAVRLRVLANPKDKADEAWAEVPDLPNKFRAGHAWGRLWVARQNTRLAGSGSREAEKKTVSAWPTPAIPFGLAGVALGLQDK